MKNKENKNAVINFRVTDSQKQEMDACAAEMNLSVSGYLSHLIFDYEGRKKLCEELKKKNIELLTQKDATEASWQELKQDADLLSNSNFTNFYESVKGKLVGDRRVKSKADLLGVLLSAAEITVVDDGLTEIDLPLEVRNYKTEAPENNIDYMVWIVLVVVILFCSVSLGIYLGRRARRSRMAG
jgi:antitoxin component of RelBE/YafQ-DinJ toxin-antitoxin module